MRLMEMRLSEMRLGKSLEKLPISWKHQVFMAMPMIIYFFKIFFSQQPPTSGFLKK